MESQIANISAKQIRADIIQEKTLITDVRRKHIHFLGYGLKMIPENSRIGYITKTIPDKKRLQQKVESIAEAIKKIPRNFSKEQFIGEINRVNSQVRGIIQYFQCCTWVKIVWSNTAADGYRQTKRKIFPISIKSISRKSPR